MTTFVSYDADRHGQYKHLISAWSINDDYFIFEDNSTDRSVNSDNAAYIKQRIKNDIARSSIFLVIVGDYTSKNKWVNWECEVAKKMNKPIAVIKIHDRFGLPSELQNNYGFYGFYIYNGFTKENVRAAIDGIKTLF